MRRIGRQVFFQGSALDPAETARLIGGLRPEDLAGMARRLLAGPPRARLAYGRRSAAAAKALGLAEREAGRDGEDA